MQTVRNLLNRLTKFYWSENPPETYVIKNPTSGEHCGIGLIASQNYGAFNLTWVSSKGEDNWRTFAGQTTLCVDFTRNKPITQHKVNGVCLVDYLCLYSQKEFTNWMRIEKNFPTIVKLQLENLLGNVERSV